MVNIIKEEQEKEEEEEEEEKEAEEGEVIVVVRVLIPDSYRNKIRRLHKYTHQHHRYICCSSAYTSLLGR